MLLATPLVAAGCGRVTAGSAPAPAASPAGEWSAFGEYLKRRAAAGQFSGTVLAVDGGHSLLAEGYGWADRSHGIANTVQTKFCICSMGKMFTAVAVAQLVEQGRLGFGDTIGTYVPGFPPAIANRVTIHELLTHTAGFGDALARRPSQAPPPDTLAGLMRIIVRTPLEFEPGRRFSYSNSGYITLGAVVENVTGQSYESYTTQHVLRPAGMTDTAIRVYTPAEVPGMAHGYALAAAPGPTPPAGAGTAARAGTGAGTQPPAGPPGPPQPSAALTDNSDVAQIGNPSGGAYSTAPDMISFGRALLGHRLLSADLTSTVLAGKVATHRPGGGPDDKYGYGFEDTRIAGVRIVGHNGGSPGYEGQLDLYPDKGAMVVILTNQDNVLRPAIRESENILTR